MRVEYNNLYTHLILTTLHRLPLIQEINRIRIEKFITGIVKNNDCYLYSIYANPDHVHILVSRHPMESEGLLVNNIGNSTERFINGNNLCQGSFKWQNSCSAFSVSKSGVDKVCQYILNQQNHHRSISSEEEYKTFIKFYQKTIKIK